MDKTPSDEGFTELEPTMNGSSDDPDPTSRPPGSTLSRDQQVPLGPPPSDPEEDPIKRSVCRKPTEEEEDEDEGLAPNSSVEDGESSRSSSETEKQRLMSREAIDTKARKATASTGSQEFVSVDMLESGGEPTEQKNAMSSLKDGAGADGKTSPVGPGEQEKPHGEASGLSEEERRKKTYKAEVKSWLLERMQAPIQGKQGTTLALASSQMLVKTL